MCDSSQDCTYGAVGGRWQRVDPCCGRVGSLYDPADAQIVQDAAAPTADASEAEPEEVMPETEAPERTLPEDGLPELGAMPGDELPSIEDDSLPSEPPMLESEPATDANPLEAMPKEETTEESPAVDVPDPADLLRSLQLPDES